MGHGTGAVDLGLQFPWGFVDHCGGQWSPGTQASVMSVDSPCFLVKKQDQHIKTSDYEHLNIQLLPLRTLLSIMRCVLSVFVPPMLTPERRGRSGNISSSEVAIVLIASW